MKNMKRYIGLAFLIAPCVVFKADAVNDRPLAGARALSHLNNTGEQWTENTLEQIAQEQKVAQLAQSGLPKKGIQWLIFDRPQSYSFAQSLEKAKKEINTGITFCKKAFTQAKDTVTQADLSAQGVKNALANQTQSLSEHAPVVAAGVAAGALYEAGAFGAAARGVKAGARGVYNWVKNNKLVTTSLGLAGAGAGYVCKEKIADVVNAGIEKATPVITNALEKITAQDAGIAAISALATVAAVKGARYLFAPKVTKELYTPKKISAHDLEPGEEVRALLDGISQDFQKGESDIVRSIDFAIKSNSLSSSDAQEETDEMLAIASSANSADEFDFAAIEGNSLLPADAQEEKTVKRHLVVSNESADKFVDHALYLLNLCPVAIDLNHAGEYREPAFSMLAPFGQWSVDIKTAFHIFQVRLNGLAKNYFNASSDNKQMVRAELEGLMSDIRKFFAQIK